MLGEKNQVAFCCVNFITSLWWGEGRENLSRLMLMELEEKISGRFQEDFMNISWIFHEQPRLWTDKMPTRQREEKEFMSRQKDPTCLTFVNPMMKNETRSVQRGWRRGAASSSEAEPAWPQVTLDPSTCHMDRGGVSAEVKEFSQFHPEVHHSHNASLHSAASWENQQLLQNKPDFLLETKESAQRLDPIKRFWWTVLHCKNTK